MLPALAALPAGAAVHAATHPRLLPLLSPQHDIPGLAAAAAAAHPSVECVVAEPIGIDSLMAQLIESRVAAAAQHGAAVAPPVAAAGAAARSSSGSD